MGEVSDVLYQEQAETNAKSVAQLAFQFAQNLGILLTKVGGKTAAQPSLAGAGASGTEAQRLQVARDNATAQIADLQAQNIALAKQIASARKNTVAALQEQQEQVQGRLELQKALSDALGKLSSSTETQTSSGLLGDIARLQHSAPELIDTKAKPIAPPILENLSSARDAGISTQATVIFQLLSTRHDLEQRMRDVDVLRTQATDMRTPIIKILKTTIQEGQSLQNAPPPDGSNPAPPTDGTNPAPSPVDTRKRYDQLTATFSALATATLPLSEEVLLLDQSTSNLAAWHSAVDVEYNIILRSLLIRVLEIAVALGILFLISELWRRATTKYILDVRRRRQLLLIRRIVIGFFTGCVLIFGFVTQFNSLATFAGFITAGIAVGLQTILLSVAAYFFIVGRFGVRVGDRITVAGVTGDVIEVGLVRFYLIELTGTGTELHSTGRVAVFANSVLFQAGTPLYKQLPGTEYAWHELTVKLNQTANYQLAVDAVTKVVNDVYATYKARIDQQHRQVETWMDNAIEAPQIESRMQLTDGGLQFALLFPVEIKDAADVDSNITEQLVSAMNTNEEVRNAIAATPLIKASIKA